MRRFHGTWLWFRNRCRNFPAERAPASIPILTNDSPVSQDYHRCVLCKRRRSRNYQRRHPLPPGESPWSGICHRPRCVAFVDKVLLPWTYPPGYAEQALAELPA